MLRSRSWFGGLLGKPKNPHSLEHLKYLYNVLSKNQTVSESNRSLLVETLRSIAEILIWGDQNDSTVFDFFLEKNMLSFFLKIMKQKCGSYVCVQLLQTLNILFENIRNETSLYYLLSNNHVNSIIVHKFDFSDEEVMAYYISFLKTLSLKLNSHTVHFFYNEHTNDFPLYTEAIKFFNHPESMVRIAVRTLTLNVYRVDDSSMLGFIRDKTAAPYFSNLVWFIGKHVAELDTCVRGDSDHQCQNRLADLVAEHLDHLHYLNDILQLEISDLNQVLTDHLLSKLFLPLYIGSLSTALSLKDKKNNVSKVVALFLLSQVFLIISHEPLVQLLAGLLLGEGSTYDCSRETPPISVYYAGEAPPNLHWSCENTAAVADTTASSEMSVATTSADSDCSGEAALNDCSGSPLNASISDEEKSKMLGLSREEERTEVRRVMEPAVQSPRHKRLSTKPCLHSILHCLDSVENDYSALFALCLLYAIGHNPGVGKERLIGILSPADSANDYNLAFVEKLVKLICQGCIDDQRIRLVSMELALILLRELAGVGDVCVLSDSHLAALAGGKEDSTSVLRNYYKTEEMFLDLFEDEYNLFTKKPLNVEFLMMDAAVLLPPTATPMTGIEFSKRLPCGEVERARRAIRVFFLMRDLCLALGIEQETQTLPLTNPQSCVQVDNVLDLNNSDLIACTVITKDGTKIRRFLVMDVLQLILVEPDTKRLGWGVAKLVGFLQDLEVSGDKDDSRCLHITIHKPLSSSTPARVPLLSAKFVFDDHIRCMAARQRLTKGRNKARQKKMHLIAKLLDLPSNIQPCPSPLYARSRPGSAGRPGRDLRPSLSASQRAVGPVSLRRESAPEHSGSGRSNSDRRERPRSGVDSRSRERSSSRQRTPDSKSPRRAASGSPRMPRPRSEEIPLEDIKNKTRRENILLLGVQQNKFSAPPIAVAGTSTAQPVVPVELSVQPEETSFTEEGGDTSPKDSTSDAVDRKDRRKGQVETV